MTRVGMGAEARRTAGISDGLLRPSVGLEDENDLISGLAAGLDTVPHVAAGTPSRAFRDRSRLVP